MVARYVGITTVVAALGGGCGRVGFSLLPFPDGGYADSNSPMDAGSDADGSGLADGGAGLDASDAADDADATTEACTPSGEDDSTCDGVDDDCDGEIDEDYETSPTHCGEGACASTGSVICSGGSELDTCAPGSPIGADDNDGMLGVDDDCDGEVDEDVVCSDPEMRLAAGAHEDIAFSPECTVVTIRLWGAGGAGGQNVGVLGDVGGRGGGGGYAESTFSVTSATLIDVYVGEGSPGCRTPGTNEGSSEYDGGRGGQGSGSGNDGEDGQDGLVSGGGNGEAPTGGPAGGDGYYGGGGAGSGGTGTGPFSGDLGDGGGGGAASVVLVDGSVTIVAGGGGGGGGASGNYDDLPSSRGGQGGVGCSGDATGANLGGGGAGGGGICVGDITQPASGRNPHDPANHLRGQARGGIAGCNPGTGGYAVLFFSR